MRPMNLFYFYDLADEELRQELEKHLSPLQQDNIIKTWHVGMIQPGDVYGQIQRQQLQQASIVLLLLSPDFIASIDIHEKGLKQAFEQQAAGTSCIILILLRPVAWEDSPLADFPYFPQNRKPVVLWENKDSAFLEIARGLKQFIRQDKQIANRYGSENIQAPKAFLTKKFTALLPGIKRVGQFFPYGLSVCAAMYLLLLWTNRQYEIATSHLFVFLLSSTYDPIFLCIAAVISELGIFWERHHYSGQKHLQHVPSTLPIFSLPALASFLNLSVVSLSLVLLFLPPLHTGPVIASIQQKALQITQHDSSADSYWLPTPLPAHYSLQDYDSSHTPQIPVVHTCSPGATPEDQNVSAYHLVLQLYNQNQQKTLQISKVVVIIDAIDSVPRPLNFWQMRANPSSNMGHLFIATHNNYQSPSGTRIVANSPLPPETPPIALKPHDSDTIDVDLRSTWPVSMTFHVEITAIANQQNVVLDYQQSDFHVIFTDDTNWHPYYPDSTGLFVPYQGKE